MLHRAQVLVWALCCWGALAAKGDSERYSLRLFGGGSRCRGELQAQWSGQDWAALFTWSTVPVWLGGRVCAELDCGVPLSVEEKIVSRRQAFDFLASRCEDKPLIHCFGSRSYSSDDSVEVTCSDSVRLVPGSSLCSGPVQIWDSDRSWTSVCEGALGRRGAEVLCRELGCGAPLLQGALSPLGQMFHCEGHESALMDCPRNQTRTCPGPALNLTCSDPVRLVGGLSRCEGLLEVKHNKHWRRVGTNFYRWDVEAAAAVCRLLDCGSAAYTKSRKDLEKSRVWGVGSDCVREKKAVRDCVITELAPDDGGLEVVCSDSVRLVSGRSLCSGSVQISADESRSWTSVCEGALDRRGAEVLCRELGCGAPLLQGALSPLRQMFHCEGHESALMDCPRNQTRTDPGTCPTLQLTCSEPVRLGGGASRCEGAVELQYRGEWRRVLPVSPHHWDLEVVAAVCRDVGCGAAVSANKRFGENRNSVDVWSVRSDCMKEAAAVRQCAFDDVTRYDERQEVVCSDSVRLVSGRSLCSGSVQIRASDRSWTSVCEGALDRRGAEVLCRELGCGAPLLQGALSPLGQTFHCEGHESALMDCPRNQTRTDPGTCPTLQLTCSEPLRLVGGAGRCQGALQVKYRAEWRRVVPSIFRHWDLETASAACGLLGCGSAVSAEERGGYDISDVWGVASECLKKKGAARDCVYDIRSNFNDGLELACSESVRLVSGRSLCSGSVQIRDQSQSWTSVCEGALDRRGAEVLCRELGCGAPLLQGALSPLGQTFHCEGHESALMDCPRNQTRTCPGPALNLTCSEPLRLVGGAGRCEGTVEVRHRGEWRRLGSTEARDPWGLEAAGAVCRDLGCGSAVSTEKKDGFDRSDVWDVSAECTKTTAVRHCVFARVSDSDQGLAVVCSGHQGSPEDTGASS